MNPKSLLSSLLGITSLAIFGIANITPAAGATAGFGTDVPAVLDGVQNLNFSTNDATNTAVAFAANDYLAGDNQAALGQTFTTGSNAAGYTLSAISLRQVSWGTTFWDYTGGTITLQVFKLNSWSGGVGSITPLAQETATVGGEPDGIGISSGTPGANAQWLTVTLDTPVTLEANVVYGFQIMSDGMGTNDGFFIQVDGTNTNSYADGFALGTGKPGFVASPLNVGTLDTTAVWRGNDGAPSDRAFVATMTAVPPPAAPVFVTQPPANVFGNVGGSITLTATAASDPAPTYQWQFSPDGIAAFANLSDAGALSGTATNTLTIQPAAYANGGYYRVVATNTNGSTNSEEAVLNLSYPDPVITQQPQPVATAAGGNVSLSVTATGLGNLSYQWFKADPGGDIQLVDAGNIFGATTATLQLGLISAADEGLYYVVVSDDAAVPDEVSPTTSTSSAAWVAIPELLVTSATTAPATDEADQFYLPGTVAKAANVSGGGDAFTYIAFDRASKGMSFTTDTNPGGYSLGSITLQHVLHAGTAFNVQNADLFEFRFGTLSGTTKTVLYQTNKAAYAGDPLAGINVAGTGRFFTIDLSDAGIATLAPDTTYYFEITTERGDPFLEWNGTSADGYAGGAAFGGTTTAAIDDSYAAMTGDRAFHADLTPLSGPANTYASWISGYPGVGALTGFNDDADGDGLDNGLENLFGTDPSISNQGITQVARSGNTITFQHPASATPASDVTAAYVWSTDLATFNADGATVGGTTVAFAANTVAGTTTVTATITGTVPAKLFAVLKAVQAP
jgi:hypothetical protein